MKIRDARSLSPEAQEDIRCKAVQAVLDGKKRVEAARLFGVSRQIVGVWVKEYREDGIKVLRSKPRGRPKGSSLKPWQSAQIVKAITDRTPDQYKLPFYLWTRESVAQLIERKFKISISVWTIGRYLARWGFTPQKPARKAFEQNPREVKKWLEIEYPKIHRQAKRWSAEIYLGDEMGLRSDHATGSSYAPQGQTPFIPGPGQRFGCNMISAITNRGRLVFMVFKGRFEDKILLDFLKRLLRQIKRKVFLIVDRHPVHRSRKVAAWLQRNRKDIRMFYLPAYSPELNPDEILNQDTKSNAVGRRRAHNQLELMKNVRGFLRGRQRQPHIVKRYFNENHVCYAAK